MARRSRAGLREGAAPGGVEPPHAASKAAALSAELRGRAGDGGVTDGTRTHNHRDHNPGLYQLSYGHRADDSLATEFERDMTNASFRSRWVARRFRASGVSTRSRPPQCSKLLGRRLPGSGVPRCTEDRLGRVVSLADAQQRALSALHEDGIALLSFTDLFDANLWRDLQADMEPFVRDGERAAAGAGPAPRKKNDVIIRRFYRDGDESEKHTFLLDDPTLPIGSADAVLDIVSAYRNGWTKLYYADNWFTVPYPSADGGSPLSAGIAIPRRSTSSRCSSTSATWTKVPVRSSMSARARPAGATATSGRGTPAKGSSHRRTSSRQRLRLRTGRSAPGLRAH